ncbi:MAG: M3 family oligoendopeptidase [Lachnospiraceae bacterium]|nr:M3 family oligoendopeptidase [Lachnospiraceae bacterium]
MRFQDMQYERPDKEAVKQDIKACTARLEEAADYKAARAAFLDMDNCMRHVQTLGTLAHIRHTIDTRDAFYEAEERFFNEASPEIEEYSNAFTKALLASPFRKEFAEEFGKIIFTNAEIDLKAFSPEIIPDMQQENDLVTEYEKLLATAKVPFEGKEYTISQMTTFKTDPDDTRRLAAWKAEGQWYKDNQTALDDLYDRLVRLRNGMAKKMGYENYVELGYYRMRRNCYTKQDVEGFRKAVTDFLVPVADSVYREQAKRLHKEYPMSFADNALEFRSGNPRPKGDADDILAAGRKFYDALSPETGAFFRMMLDDGLMDVLSREGKRGGGYMTELPEYEAVFIFANFNGTQGDVEVVTHEAGHAFAGHVNRKRVPLSTVLPTMEACEVHSMAMEFFAEPFAEDFFGEEARKYRYTHLTKALTFIPYGTMVDHFQHLVYEKPDMTPAERHAEWKNLLGIYMPWIKLDGDIPFYADGEGWQRQHHIYSMPFYYIDYCLAQTVALSFWARIQDDRRDAWDHYMAYTKQGGGATFTELLANAGLDSPFGPDTLEKVCTRAKTFLDAYDLSGIE